MRACSACSETLPASSFYLGGNGKPRGKCKSCHLRYLRRYYEKNRDALLEKSKVRYSASEKKKECAARSSARAEAARLRKKAFRAEYERRPHVAAYRSEYKNKPERKEVTRRLSKRPEKLSARAAKARQLRATDPKFLISGRMSSLIRARLRGAKAGRSWKRMVDYTPEELIAHLERQFLPGMGWHNASEWHVDHIVPVSSFDYTSPDDLAFKRCWSLPILRPLWGADNIRKSDRVETLL